MKTIKFALKIWLFTWIFWIAYNTYFGWNLHSQSNAESTCDLIFKVALNIGIVIYFMPLLKLYEKAVKLFLD